MKSYSFPASKAILLLVNAFFYFISSISAQHTNQRQKSSGWTVKDPFKSEVFIENNGQFNEPDKQPLKNVRYAVNNGNLKLYFTPSGLSYHVINVRFNPKYKNEKEDILEKMESQIKKNGKPDESLKKYFSDKSAYLNIEWEGSNPDAQILVSEKVQHHYSYSVKDGIGASKSVLANAFKKLTYKNIYPNIDIEYYFPENNDKLGVKYNIVVHPGGDLSLVKMKYNGMQNISLDANGNIVASIPDGNITDHAPGFSYAGNNSNQLKAKFILQDQTVSFDVPNYDKTKKLVIDPFTSVWSINPGFTTTNDGYTIRIDYSHNVYVMGGGVNLGGFPFAAYDYQVEKFNPAGVLQWIASALASTNGGSYGDMVVLRDGKAIVGMGFSGGNTGYITDSFN